MRFFTLIRLTALWLSGTLFPGLLIAQTTVDQPVIKFGQVTSADFQLMPVPNDTTAEAVVLYESADAKHEYRNETIVLVTRYYSRVRINKKTGYDHATQTIPLHGTGSNSSYVSGLDGLTHTLQNGQVTKVKMDRAAIVTERLAPDLSLQKFTLPNVREGCIIEYRYTTYSPNVIAPASWGFQQAIPVIWSEYKATISNYFYIKIILGGYLPLTIHKTGQSSSGLINGQSNEGSVDHHFAVANAPAFRDEPFITTARDYESRVDFELASVNIPGLVSESYSLGWGDVDRTLLMKESFGEQYKRAPYLSDVADVIRQKYALTDTLGRATAAYDHVRNAMTWNEENNLSSTRLKKVMELKKGDAADLNFMLIGLLRDLAIDANPVILSTRGHGRVSKEYGLLRQFNYVVAHLMLGGKDVLLDATDRFVRPGMLPQRALNGVGRLILPNGQSRFVSLTPDERDVEARMGTFTLSEDGEIRGTLSHSYAGYGAVNARASYARRRETGFVDDVKRKKPSWQITKADFRNVADLSKPMTVDYSLTVADAAPMAGDRIYLNPMLTEGEQENPFKQPERQYPVDFTTPFDETFTATYTLPDGYVVDELPKPLLLSLPDNGGRFVYQLQQKGNQVSIMSRLTVKNAVFPAAGYMLLKEFYEKIMLKHGEQVVLRKGPSVAEKK